jgi:hypothetical protein
MTMDTDPPAGNGSRPDGCALAHVAFDRADRSERAALKAHEYFGQCLREISGLRAEMREGFAQLGAKTQSAEDTGRHEVDALKLALKEQELVDIKQGQRASADRKWSMWVALIAVVATAGAGILFRVIEAAIRGHW